MKILLQADYRRAFKDADIRGIYPTEIDEEVTYLIARSFVDEYQCPEMVVGRDMRLSTPTLFDAFCKGVVDAGANVLDIGLVHTPLVYYVSGSRQIPGVMITASHSPKDHNGLKLVLPGAIPLTEQHGLGKLRRRLERGKFVEPERVGKVRLKDFSREYQRFITKGMSAKKLTGIRVAADCGNGMASVVLPLMAEKLPVTFTSILTELDGRFPYRGSDPTLRKNQRHISKLLKNESFDFGVAFDGDGDRVAFFDEQGKYVNSALIGALIAEYLLQKTPKTGCVYTNLTSRVYEESIKAAHGIPLPARVGHAFIKEVMRKRGAVFGCEHSGHFYYKDFFYTDSIALTVQYMLQIYATAKQTGKTFSQLVAPYQRYTQTEDVIVPVSDQPAALAAAYEFLMKRQPIKVKKFDGWFFDFGEVWGSVKISVTEPALKMMFEGKKKKDVQVLQDELAEFVRTLS